RRRVGGVAEGAWARQREAQAVGYSCVLFALMTLMSVAQETFCPVPFFPQFCFETWFLPIPLTRWKLPINLGPFALLFLVQFIMPQAGFLGHLSGIVMGYPTAWGLLNPLSTPLLASLSAVGLVHHSRSWPWKMGDYRLLLQGW
ncbi:unnamed protein product, partial [Discosporangium mesarthrocarpum]